LRNCYSVGALECPNITDEGVKYLEYILESTASKSLFLQSGRLSYEVEFQDDRTGYKDVQGNIVSGEIGIPSARSSFMHNPVPVYIIEMTFWT